MVAEAFASCVAPVTSKVELALTAPLKVPVVAERAPVETAPEAVMEVAVRLVTEVVASEV